MNTLSNFSLNNILFYPQETSFDESQIKDRQFKQTDNACTNNKSHPTTSFSYTEVKNTFYIVY